MRESADTEARRQDGELERLSDRNKPTLVSDRRYFARHGSRSYRIRLASAAEVEILRLLGDDRAIPAGHRWHVAIRQVMPVLRLRSFFLAPVGTTVEQPEVECRRVFHLVAGPAWTAIGDRAASLRRLAS